MVSGLENTAELGEGGRPTCLFFLAGGGFRYGHEIKELVEESPIDRIWL